MGLPPNQDRRYAVKMNEPPLDTFYEPPGKSIRAPRLNGGRTPTTETTLRTLEGLEMEPVTWIWKGWLAKAKFHLIAGAPEAGKTTIGLSFVAAISSGNYWPDVTRAVAGNCLIWTSEDGLADTIKPRLIAMGADLSHVWFIENQREADGKKRPFDPARDMPSLVTAAGKIPGGIDFLMLDPIVAAVGTKTNSHNNAETRNALQPVLDFAEAADCAVIGVTHFTKGTAGKDPVERVTGSVAFGALARIIMIATKNEAGNSDPPRILVRAKSNISPSGGGFGYDIVAAPLYERLDIIATRIAWHEPIEGTAREILAEAEGERETGGGLSKKDRAEKFLKTALAGGERPQKDIEAQAKQEGIMWGTLKRASEGGGVAKRKDGLSGGWLWSLRDVEGRMPGKQAQALPERDG
jgi:putative DNA primase/helicase